MRQLIKQREVIVDEWRYADEDPVGRERALILPFARWKAEREQWWLWDGRLGVRLGVTDKVEELKNDFTRIGLVALGIRRHRRRPWLQPGGVCSARVTSSRASCAPWVRSSAINCSIWRAVASIPSSCPKARISTSRSRRSMTSRSPIRGAIDGTDVHVQRRAVG